MSILDLYQHSLCGHFGEDGPEQLTRYSLIEQLSGASSKDSKGKESPSVSYCGFYITSHITSWLFLFASCFLLSVLITKKPGRHENNSWPAEE